MDKKPDLWGSGFGERNLHQVRLAFLSPLKEQQKGEVELLFRYHCEYLLAPSHFSMRKFLPPCYLTGWGTQAEHHLLIAINKSACENCEKEFSRTLPKYVWGEEHILIFQMTPVRCSGHTL
ncbi:MAG: hypothetical protein A2836_01335 [Candidatus Taylorbacteria bacterium RIFCSPHIGHO2_01_FULL_45_63]|uniref:Uncharacterized protein n=1 Tax=Candidatus Taylorbacteria bacterium RIFCSPHIGHO2_02_FULL_45_35 TaxID=1802311 RepID=A0A1G2MWA0_9BACT|nr:MAG: hypothetical protein A2836_01335 [Candidatus Taylorbacteria bacterium RIFCSPHIGHO2_01_FULL_45_63]OHA28054.1 MAG: hypothetical protein A3D56_00040 [Candidatus Taylorbacteria bacterium RIFCSPHIGHO2_02_FULL_45_35]OHA34879.1 MAG: hypothetical protein A3A22_02835 [Candidatus Taylorbacteria bacterium RIFCSPLOWO2_01_FULL_45_34b]